MRIFDFFFQKTISRRISAFQDEMMNRHVAEVENLYRQRCGAGGMTTTTTFK